MTEKWRTSLREGRALRTLPTNLSKAYDCFPQELSIAKLHLNAVDISSLKLLHWYLTRQENKDWNWVAYTVYGLKLSLGFCKAQCLDYCYLTHFYATHYNFSPIFILPITQMVTLTTQLIWKKVLHKLEK